MTMHPTYRGPERRQDAVTELWAHVDARLDAQDEKIDKMAAKVDAMYDQFITARTTATWLKWLAGFGGSIGGLWLLAKDWFHVAK